jgi:hypothetical protein
VKESVCRYDSLLIVIEVFSPLLFATFG